MRRLVGTTRLLDAFDSLRRRLVGASVGGLLAATVLPAGLLAVVPTGKSGDPLSERSRLTLPLEGAARPSSFEAIERREGIEGHLTPADIRRGLIASRAQRKRILRAHPHFLVYKAAKRRYGVSWFLVAALHHERRRMSDDALMRAARGLRAAGVGSALDRRAWRAVRARFRGSPTAATTATVILERARAWKQLGVIPLPAHSKLATPVDGVVPGCGYFHCPRPGHLHNGLDLSAPVGTPIHAVQAGRVAVLEESGESGGYGRFVCLQHAPSLASCYAHLSSFAPGLEPGREVGRGEVIGLVGCTGHCYGAHLHFEIRRGPAECSACAVDPVPYLSGKAPDIPAPDLRSGPQEALRPPQSRLAPALPAVPPPPSTPSSPSSSTPSPSSPAPPSPAAPDPAATPPQPGRPAAPAPRPDDEPDEDAPRPARTPSNAPGRQPPSSPAATGGAAPTATPAPPPPPPANPPPPPAAQAGGTGDPSGR
jgi:hypothetical protein